jgi:tetratricopeptide (TPR) repeat protein
MIVEIHRRSLWQVLTVYLGASWIVLEAANQVIERYLLPEWVYPAALVLLLIGLPIVLATALVREDRAPSAPAEPRDPTLMTDPAAIELDRPAEAQSVKRFLTWPKAIAGGVLAFAALALISGLIVVRGTARVTEAYGAAGEAFTEREWIVVTEFEAPEGEAEVGLAVREALTVDLQQSLYVNVYGRDQVGPVLRRMGLPDTTRLDRRLALEVAEREGLAAVLEGRITRLGADYVLSARVVQPGSGTELIAVRSAASADNLLEGVEKLSREVRGRLGEESAAIRRSRPLPEVTTGSLEALKVYAQAVQASADQRYPQALELSLRALEIDSTFAMGHRLASVSFSNLGRFAESAQAATRAFELRARLPDRERLHVEGFYYVSIDGEFDPRRAAEIYELLLSRYPDDYRAANNLGFANSVWMGNPERAEEAYLKAVELGPYSAVAYSNALIEMLGLEHIEAAESLSAVARERGVPLSVTHSEMPISVARWDWERADSLCRSASVESGGPGQALERQTFCGSLEAARGRMRSGIGVIESTSREYAQYGQVINHTSLQVGLASMELIRGQPGAARARIEAVLDRFPADSIADGERHMVRAHLTYAAGELGLGDLIDRIVQAYPRERDPDHWFARYGATMEDAAIALAQGDPEAAVGLLDGLKEFGYYPIGWQYDRHLMFGLAFDALGQADSAIVHYRKAYGTGQISVFGTWVVRGPRTQLASATRRLAELEESRGNTEEAVRQYRRFLSLWSDPDPELRDQVESARRALARLTGAESI